MLYIPAVWRSVRSNPWVLSTYMYVIMLWGVLSVDVLLLLEWFSCITVSGLLSLKCWLSDCPPPLCWWIYCDKSLRVCFAHLFFSVITFCWFKWIWRCIVCLILGTPTLTRDCFSNWLSQPWNIKMLLFHAVNLMPDRDPRLHFHWTYCATIQHFLSRDFTRHTHLSGVYLTKLDAPLDSSWAVIFSSSSVFTHPQQGDDVFWYRQNCWKLCVLM